VFCFKARISSSMGSLVDMGAPRVIGGTTRNFLTHPLTSREPLCNRVRLPSCVIQGDFLRDIRPLYCPSQACKWGPGWSDYRKNRKQSSSSCFGGSEWSGCAEKPYRQFLSMRKGWPLNLA